MVQFGVCVCLCLSLSLSMLLALSPTGSIFDSRQRRGQDDGEELPMIERLFGDDFDAAHDVADFRRNFRLGQVKMELHTLLDRPDAQRVDVNGSGDVVIRMLERVDEGRGSRDAPRKDSTDATYSPVLRRRRLQTFESKSEERAIFALEVSTQNQRKPPNSAFKTIRRWYREIAPRCELSEEEDD